MTMEPAYKKVFADWFFNEGQIYSTSGTTEGDMSIGLAWNNPYVWTNELTNSIHDGREWWFRGWWERNDDRGPRRRVITSTINFTYNSATNRIVYDQSSVGWIAPFSGYYGITNAGSTSPTIYAAPSHLCVFNVPGAAANQSQYSDTLIAVFPITPTPAWQNGFWFDSELNYTDHTQPYTSAGPALGDWISPSIGIEWGVAP